MKARRRNRLVQFAISVTFSALAGCGSAGSPAASGESADVESDLTPAERDFVPPTFDLDVPSPPSIATLTVKAGLDGRTPEQVIKRVESRLTNSIAPENEQFVESTIRTTHKYFTVAVNNIFSQGSPPAAFVKNLGGADVTVLGTMSAMHPTVLRVESAGQPAQHFVIQDGTYVAFPDMRYPVIMECKIRLAPAGVMLRYPEWSAKVLAGSTGTITEGH